MLRRFLSRLPKQNLVSLVLIWLDHPLCPIHTPLDDDDEYFMEEEESLEEKREKYVAQKEGVNVTKKAVIDRILGQDWVLPTSPVVLRKCSFAESMVVLVSQCRVGVDVLEHFWDSCLDRANDRGED